MDSSTDLELIEEGQDLDFAKKAERRGKLLDRARVKIEKWAEAKVDGKLDSVGRPDMARAKTFEEQTVDDVVSDCYGLALDWALRDMVEVEIWLREYVAADPERLRYLEGLLIHVCHRHQSIESYAIPVPFTFLRRRLGVLGPGVVGSATSELFKFRVYVANKIEQEIAKIASASAAAPKEGVG